MIVRLAGAIAAPLVGLQLASHGAPPVIALVGVVVGVVLWKTAGPTTKAKPAVARMNCDLVEIRTHGGHGTRHAALHEAGHRRYAKKRGWEVVSTEIFPDGTGVTKAYIPKDATVAEIVGMCEAGAAAAGTTKGCYSDFKRRDEVISTLPGGLIFEGPERAKARREGRRLAEQAVGQGLFGPRSEVSSDASKLLKRGVIYG